jgi:hypothetical protein
MVNLRSYLTEESSSSFGNVMAAINFFSNN